MNNHQEKESRKGEERGWCLRRRKQNKEKKGVGIEVNHHQEEERCKFATFPLKNEHSPPIGCSKLRKITRIQKKPKNTFWSNAWGP